VSFNQLDEARSEGLLVSLEAIELEFTDVDNTHLEFLISVGAEQLLIKTRWNIPTPNVLAGNGLALIVRLGTATLAHTRGDAVLLTIQRIEGNVIFAGLLSLYFIGPSVQGETTPSQHIHG
jgi:hypothetical protein